jgi:hypothetical protein
MLWREVPFDEVIRLDADGRLTSVRPMTVDELSKFDRSDPRDVAFISKLYEAYTGKTGIEERRAAAKWLERFNITTRDARYEREFERLIEQGASARSVLAEERRAAERAELVQSSGGDLDMNAVYVNEGPDPCEECQPLNGEMMTIREFDDAGMMPGDRCLGGDNCRCILIPIRDTAS